MRSQSRVAVVVCLVAALAALAALRWLERASPRPREARVVAAPGPSLAPSVDASVGSPAPAPAGANAVLPARPDAALALRVHEARNEAVRVAGSIPGKVEGWVPGGVVGGLVGGLPTQAPMPGPGGRYAQKMAREPEIDRGPADFHTEAYDRIRDSPFLAVANNPLSTFSIDVDTASYANVRRFLAQGQLPPKDAVRIEELLNYFRYDYPEPRGETPFSVTTEVAACPWKPEHRLVRVGLRGRSLDAARVPPRRLTFLLDVSGSMDTPNKLPLLKEAMGLLVENLREQDRVAIVVYAGSSGLVLAPTSGDRRAEIRDALASLEAGGSTAGGAGIQLAYRVASEMLLPGGVNRVVLATDGDFNVGTTSAGELARLIEEKRRGGVFLSVLGFGEGNLKDSTMEMLADRGNGNYAYIDGLTEARKVLVTEAGGTLVTIAKDVKIQVELNPGRVAAYRLVGYENRLLRAEDFADDGKDAGDIGAGHTVTALYEIVPRGVATSLPGVEPPRYRQPASLSGAAASEELMTVKLRYKEPDGETSRLLSVAVRDGGARASEDLRFAAAVAEFGLLLRESEHRGGATWAQARELAEGARGRDAGGYRAAFLDLVRRAEELSSPRQAAVAR
jgi:Ca-activated chloride channel family protein